jgi:hypothetical protein
MRHARVLAFAGLAVSVAVAFAQTSVVPIPDNAPVRTAPLEGDVGKLAWGDPKAVPENDP